MAVDVGTTMDDLLACVVLALEDAGRPVARSGQTVGPAVLGPTACCAECDECGNGGGGHGQVTVALQRMYPIDATTFAQVVQLEDCRPGTTGADLFFTLARCHPTINEQGTPPTLEDVAPYADGVSDDAQTMWNTFVCPCEGTKYRVVIRNLTIDSDPLGGCSGIGLQITVLVKPTAPVVS